jgi:tungstate transport system substrate-binding protein
MRKYYLFLVIISLLSAACSNSEPQVLRLATTTSTDNSGLLDAILPDFEAKYNARVDVVAVGTGQAIALGEAGDADVILVHARSREDEFVAAGHGSERFDVMYNDFVIVGPAGDPAGIQGLSLAQDALAAIADAEATFASRGDDSGTHTKEKALWAAAGFPAEPTGEWYKSLGQGMGDTLRFANESNAYTMSDRGTFLALQENLPDLVVLVGGNSIAENEDEALFNPYGVIPVNLDKGNIAYELAQDFAAWLTSAETQAKIGEFGRDTFGQPLFYPDATNQ